METIVVSWMYPDTLHLHGDRGNLMALERVGRLTGQLVEIRRHEDLRQPVDLLTPEILVFPVGELRCMEGLVRALSPQRDELADFVERGGVILAIGASGAIFARHTHRSAGPSFDGLGLLGMEMTERETVYGDDIRLTEAETGLELLGNQIQILDTRLDREQAPFGRVLYGYGNDKGGGEGARRNNLIFTNALGPLLVKNPRFTCELLNLANRYRGREQTLALDPADTVLEDRSAELIRKFIAGKPPVK